MNSAVCTLFEGDYHFGVAALTNSLYRHGFRGVVWAGYRGPLPPWAHPLVEQDGWSEYPVAEGCVLRFLPVQTDRHLTNFKPEFMLKLWDTGAAGAEALFYFDPDIVIRCGWDFFEKWVMTGVALCEDVNSPFPITHPVRKEWSRVYERVGMPLKFSTDMYVNGGFLGVSRAHRGFLSAWQKVQEVMNAELGGLAKTHLDFAGRQHLFFKTDQDALNITLGLATEPVSCIGKEGMNLIPGGFTMSHAIGAAKGWNVSFLSQALAGYPPSSAIKDYFDYVEEPIRLYSAACLRQKKAVLKLAALIGRFYRRT